jgi:hypothetical protein
MNQPTSFALIPLLLTISLFGKTSIPLLREDVIGVYPSA